MMYFILLNNRKVCVFEDLSEFTHDLEEAKQRITYFRVLYPNEKYTLRRVVTEEISWVFDPNTQGGM